MLVCHAEFAIVDEAYPYVAKMLLTDNSPRLRSALKYMVYGKDSVFDADRLIDLLAAFEDFSVASKSARGDMDVGAPRPGASFKLPSLPGKAQTADIPNAKPSSNSYARSMSNGKASTSTAYSQNGTPSGSSGNGNLRPGSRPYSSSSNGNGNASFASLDGYGSVPASGKQGNGYTASRDNKPQPTENNGLAQFDRQASSSGSGASVLSSGNGMRAESGSAVQGHSGQGKMVSSERVNSGQHASSSPGGSWGSWGSWPPQVLVVLWRLQLLIFLQCTLSDYASLMQDVERFVHFNNFCGKHAVSHHTCS